MSVVLIDNMTVPFDLIDNMTVSFDLIDSMNVSFDLIDSMNVSFDLIGKVSFDLIGNVYFDLIPIHGSGGFRGGHAPSGGRQYGGGGTGRQPSGLLELGTRGRGQRGGRGGLGLDLSGKKLVVFYCQKLHLRKSSTQGSNAIPM